MEEAAAATKIAACCATSSGRKSSLSKIHGTTGLTNRSTTSSSSLPQALGNDETTKTAVSPSGRSVSPACTCLSTTSAAAAMFCNDCADGVHLRTGFADKAAGGANAPSPLFNCRKSEFNGATGQMLTGDSAISRVECSAKNSLEGVATVAILRGKCPSLTVNTAVTIVLLVFNCRRRTPLIVSCNPRYRQATALGSNFWRNSPGTRA